jgi:hypothetical protein
MLEVELSWGKVFVAFQHSNPKRKPKNRSTHARLSLVYGGPDGQAAREFYGRAQPQCGDQFCYEEGRKVALAKALREAGLPKEERAMVWQAYFYRQGADRAASTAKLFSRIVQGDSSDWRSPWPDDAPRSIPPVKVLLPVETPIADRTQRSEPDDAGPGF